MPVIVLFLHTLIGIGVRFFEKTLWGVDYYVKQGYNASRKILINILHEVRVHRVTDVDDPSHSSNRYIGCTTTHNNMGTSAAAALWKACDCDGCNCDVRFGLHSLSHRDNVCGELLLRMLRVTKNSARMISAVPDVVPDQYYVKGSC